MITFEHHGIAVKCKPENAMQYRAAMDKPPKAKAVSEKRDYPKWTPTMSAAEYVRAYIKVNDRRRMIDCAHGCVNYDQAPAMYDGSAPEVLEELDPDYEYTPTIKARKITPKQAIVQALDALKVGDIDTAQCILEEALK
jgi:phage/plasmid-associated DNA primase